MTLYRRRIGQAGEEAARSYLQSLNYSILESNYKCPLGEIDLVALDQGVVVIVEVRTRSVRGFGEPEESITPAKGKRLKKLALYYLQNKFGRDIPCRIDLVAVRLNNDGLEILKIRHFRGILAG